jgi:hypothetical protein
LKEAVLTLILGARSLTSWVFIADIADEFILGLYVLRRHDASVVLWWLVPRLGEEEVLL